MTVAQYDWTRQQQDTQPDGASAIVSWSQAATAAAQLVAPLVRTDFVPVHFKGNVEAATAAVLYGAEAGLSPLQALQGVYVISGKPAMYAKTMHAIALAHGHEVWTIEETPARVVLGGRRRGSQHDERIVWTLDRARKAGYTKNPKYSSDPQSMLVARALSDVCRRIAPDALLGMPYSVEELEDEAQPTTTMQRVDSAAIDGAPKVAQRRPIRQAADASEEDRASAQVQAERKRRADLRRELDDAKRRRQAEPEPTIEQAVETLTEAGVVDEVVADSDGISSAQLKKLGAMMREASLTDRADALQYVSDVIGRRVESRNELTKAEASQIIERLEWDLHGDEPAQLGDMDEPSFDD